MTIIRPIVRPIVGPAVACLTANQRSGGPASALRQVASRGSASIFLDSGFTKSMGRIPHFNTQGTLTAARMVLGNWALDQSGGGEYAGSSAATFTASIEYPAGTFTQIKFGGSATGVVAAGAWSNSDKVTLVTPIPPATQFWSNIYMDAPGGILYPLNLRGGFGEAFTFGPSATDLTMVGGVGNSPGNIGANPPLLILGDTTATRSVMVIGDSKAYGTADTDSAQSPERGEITRSLWSQLPYANFSDPGERAGSFPTQGPRRIAMGQYFSHVISQYGINDLADGVSSATLIARQQAIAALFPNAKLWACTVAPKASSTDSFATLANQTVDATTNTQRIAYNTALRAGGIAGIYGVIDIASAVESSLNSGKWIVNGTANYATSDGLHETQAGMLLILASGVVNPALFT